MIATQLPEKSTEESAKRLESRTGAIRGEPPQEIERVILAVTSLLEGDMVDLSDVVCDLSQVPPLASSVYQLARAIPPGETVTYGQIAIQLGDKHLAQSVGRVLGQNPIPIIVPCHRVLGANHKLTGFSAFGGIETKRKMLAIEGGIKGETLGLFD